MNQTLKASLIAFGSFLLGLIVDAAWRPVPPDVKHWENRVIAYQRDSVGFEKSLSLLQGQIVLLEDSARTLTAQAQAETERANDAAKEKNTAKARADKAVTELATAKTAADSVPILVDALNDRTQQAEAAEREVFSLRRAGWKQMGATAALGRANDSLKKANTKLTDRLAIADDLLRDRPETDRVRCLFWDCPSRTTTFVVGAVLGAVGGVYVATR